MQKNRILVKSTVHYLILTHIEKFKCYNSKIDISQNINILRIIFKTIIIIPIKIIFKCQILRNNLLNKNQKLILRNDFCLNPSYYKPAIGCLISSKRDVDHTPKCCDDCAHGDVHGSNELCKWIKYMNTSKCALFVNILTSSLLMSSSQRSNLSDFKKLVL